MVKKISLVAMMFLFAAGLAFANANEGTNPSDTAVQTETIKGTVEKVDVAMQKITIRPDGKAETKDLTFDEKTTFWTKDKAMKVDDLKAGDLVAVEFNLMNVATKVSIVPKDLTSENKTN